MSGKTGAGLSGFAMSRRYSGYYEELAKEVKARYCEKLDSVGSHIDDPYTLEFEGISDSALMPDI